MKKQPLKRTLSMRTRALKTTRRPGSQTTMVSIKSHRLKSPGIRIAETFVLVALLFASGFSLACTTFSFSDENGHIVFGRNFDFPVGAAHIEVNKRNMRKVAFVRPPENPTVWVSKFGSITFNQIGREFPYGGMNEAGLVIEQMWLQEASYPEPDERPALTALQWIQYQLDNCKSVEEVIAGDQLVRISPASLSKLHFLVADAGGNVAAIEYIDGAMTVHQRNELPFPVLANCTYENSLEYKHSVDRKEGKQFSPWTENSSGRFVRAASLIEQYSGEKNIIDYSFDILDHVAQEKSTQWSIVYDITNKRIHFKTMRNPVTQTLKLEDFDLSCDGPDIFASISGTVNGKNSFQEYNFKANYNLQEHVVSSVDFLKNAVPIEDMIATAKYPETIICNDN